MTKEIKIPYYKYQRKSFIDLSGNIRTGEFIHKLEYIPVKEITPAKTHFTNCKVLQGTTSPFRDEFPGVILN